MVTKREYIRIGSWNIQHQHKTDDAIFSICKTIIHHNLDVVAIQETGKKEEHLFRIRTKLNEISGNGYVGNPSDDDKNIAGGFVWKKRIISKMENFYVYFGTYMVHIMVECDVFFKMMSIV